MFQVEIEGSVRDPLLRSFEIKEVANGTNIVSLEIESLTQPLYRPQLDDEIVVLDVSVTPSVRRFAGLISGLNERGFVGPADDSIVTRIDAGDYSSYTERRYVTATLPPGSLKAALQIIVTYLTDYGVTLDAAQPTGPLLPEIAFDNQRVDECLNYLSSLTGSVGPPFLWDVDYDAELSMRPVGTQPCPFNIVEGADMLAVGDIEVSPSTSDYTNQVVLVYGTNIVTMKVDYFVGDGVTDTFPLSYPIAGPVPYGDGQGAVGYAVVDRAGSESLGGLLSPPGMIWEYDPVALTIKRRAWFGGAVPFAEPFSIRYDVQFPQTITVSNVGVDETVWEKRIVNTQIHDKREAEAFATAQLTQSAGILQTITYKTFQPGARPGQMQTITVPKRQLSGQFLISEVVTRPVVARGVVEHTITAQGGAQFRGSFRDLYRAWLSDQTGTASAGVVPVVPSGGSMTDIEYLGAYTPTTYDDGDIVVADDGIAYLCTKNGVITPPEPWPGVGVSTLILGAEYWVSTAHNALTAERNFGALPSGYVKSTVASAVSTPSTVALIPLADGGTSASLTAVQGGVVWSDFASLAISTAGGNNQLLRSHATSAPDWTAGLTFDGLLLALSGNAAMSGYVGSTTYASQTTGWRIDALGGADFRYLFIDEMHAKSFITDLEQALAGGEIIAKSVTTLAASFSAPALGATQLLRARDLPSAAGMAAFEAGDTVLLRSFARAAGSLTIASCVGVVTAYSDQPDGVQHWTFTRNGGAAGGTMPAGTVIAADAVVLDFGVSGNGYYEVNAIDGAYGANSPYAQIVTWTTAPVGGNLTLRTRFGNLRGITGVAGEYGLIAGTYAGAGGQYFRASNAVFELHGIDLLLWDGAAPTVKLHHAVPSFALGNPLPTGYATGTGIWMGKDGATYKFRVGNPSGNRITWDGSTLDIAGAITAYSGTIAGDLVVGPGGTLRSGATAFNATVGWWLDYNAGAPRIRVGDPASNRLSWDGTTLVIRSGAFVIDGSASGHIGMGSPPYTIATLNLASPGNDRNTMSLFCTSANGANVSLICYGDGSIFLGNLIYVIAGTWSTEGSGQNAGLTAVGPFGSGIQPAGWMRLFVNNGSGYVQSWIPIWQG